MGLASRIHFVFNYWGIHKGNRVNYLRSLGVTIGKNCDILTSPLNMGSEPWLIEIGDHVTLTSGVVLITHDASSRLFRDNMPDMNRFGNRFGTIRILDNCFIGTNAIILPGVTIGPDAIVGAGSVVVKSVPAKTVVAGNPARPIASLDEYIDRYRKKMVPLRSTDRQTLRKELTIHFWGKER